MNSRMRFRQSGYVSSGPVDQFLPILQAAAAIVALILVLALGAALDDAREAHDDLQLLQAAQAFPLSCEGEQP